MGQCSKGPAPALEPHSEGQSGHAQRRDPQDPADDLKHGIGKRVEETQQHRALLLRQPSDRHRQQREEDRQWQHRRLARRGYDIGGDQRFKEFQHARHIACIIREIGKEPAGCLRDREGCKRPGQDKGGKHSADNGHAQNQQHKALRRCPSARGIDHLRKTQHQQARHQRNDRHLQSPQPQGPNQANAVRHSSGQCDTRQKHS